MNRFILAAATLALAACGGSGIGPGGFGNSNGCTITLGGAQTGTYNCQSALAVWDSSKNQGTFALSFSGSGSSPTTSVAISFPGEPHQGTYLNTDTGQQGGATVTVGSGSTTQYWAAIADPGSAQGSYSLKLGGVSGAYSTGNGKTYNTTGTLDATLTPVSGASGNVTLHVAF